MRYLFLLVQLFFVMHTLAQSDIKIGAVNSQVFIDSSATSSYALYLPPGYDEQKAYPVVYLFDEMGKGAQFVQQFSIAAGITNSIVVGANFAISDSLAGDLVKGKNLISNTIQRYAVDTSKIILAGYGDAALLSCARAFKDNDVYGLITIGDAYFNKKSIVKNKRLKVVVLTPDKGKHYYKLKAYSRASSLKNNLVGSYTYDGVGWPSKGYLSAALTDILLEDATATETIKAYYMSDLAYGKKLYKDEQHLLAYDFVGHLRSKYKKHIEINEQKELIRTIKNDRSYKTKRNRNARIVYAEQELIDDFDYYLREDTSEAFFDNLGWWSYQMDALDEKVESTDLGLDKRKAAMRQKKYVQALVEQKYASLNLNKTPSVNLLFINILRTLVNPYNQDAYIQTISLSAREGDSNAALFYFEELLKIGEVPFDALYHIPYTSALRISPEWNEIVKTYLGSSKYY